MEKDDTASFKSYIYLSQCGIESSNDPMGPIVMKTWCIRIIVQCLV